MNEVRAEILRRRLDHILAEWPSAADPHRDTLISEAMLIWRDIRAAEVALGTTTGVITKAG
jgi:hypothetical protein